MRSTIKATRGSWHLGTPVAALSFSAVLLFAAVPDGQGPLLCFRVDDAVSGGLLEDVEMSVFSQGAPTRHLGYTDETGAVCVAADAIQEEAVILFCKPDYFCGALLTGPGHGFGDHIALAPFSIW